MKNDNYCQLGGSCLVTLAQAVLELDTAAYFIPQTDMLAGPVKQSLGVAVSGTYFVESAARRDLML